MRIVRCPPQGRHRRCYETRRFASDVIICIKDVSHRTNNRRFNFSEKNPQKGEEMTQNVNKRPRRSKKFFKKFCFFFVRPSGPTHPLISWFTGSSPSIEPPCNFFFEKKKCLDVRVRQHQHLAAFNNFLLFSPCFCCWFFFFCYAPTGSAAKVTTSGMQMRRHICQFVDQKKKKKSGDCDHLVPSRTSRKLFYRPLWPFFLKKTSPESGIRMNSKIRELEMRRLQGRIFFPFAEWQRCRPPCK